MYLTMYQINGFLGLLGLIPIYLGIKVAIFDDCEGKEELKMN